jgi:O-antigen/teichoic acid export membrane protein
LRSILSHIGSLRVGRAGTPGAATGPGSRGLSLRANFSWTLLGDVIYHACQWGMLVLLAKLATPAVVGLFSLGLAITAPIVIFFNLQLRNAQATDARGEFSFADYFGLRLLSSVLAMIVIAVIASYYLGERQKALVILVIGLAKVAESLSDVFYGLFQQHEQMNLIATSKMLRGTLSLALFGLGVALTGQLLPGVSAMALVWLLLFVLFDKPRGEALLRRKHHSAVVSPRWVWPQMRALIMQTLPLGVVGLLVSLNSNIPRYAIERHLGEEALGLYMAMVYLIVVGDTIIMALVQAATPRLARYYASGDPKFVRLIVTLVSMGIGIGALGILAAFVFGPQVLSLLYTPEYAARADVFILVMVAAAAGYVASFLTCGMMAARKFAIQLPLYATVVAVALVSSLSLVPALGLKGAVLALAISRTVQLVWALLVNVQLVRTLRRG